MMKIRFVYPFVLLQLLSLNLISMCSGEDQRDRRSGISNSASALLYSKSNHSIMHDVLNMDPEHRNNTQIKLDNVFGVDSRIFEEYLKDEDLRIIPGLREDDDFDNWTPPAEIQRDFPVYVSGFDYQDRPIWISEWGKWRFDKYVMMGKKKLALFDKYMRYLFYNNLKSMALRSTKERRVSQFISLRDYEGLSPEDVTNRRRLQLHLKVFSNYRRFYEKYAANSIGININPIAEVFLNLVRPFYGRLFSKLEFYGTNKYIWAPQLLKSLPKDQIPERYGGNKCFVPFHTFGSIYTEH